MLYDAAGHAMLSEKSAALSVQKLAAHGLLAETLLGIPTSPVFTATRDVDTMKVAMALQINLQVQQDLDPFYVQSVSGTQMQTGVSYRTDKDGVNHIVLHPQAAMMVNSILLAHGLHASPYALVKSVRGMEWGLYRDRDVNYQFPTFRQGTRVRY